MGNGSTIPHLFSGNEVQFLYSAVPRKVIAEYASGAAPSFPSKEYLYAGNRGTDGTFSEPEPFNPPQRPFNPKILPFPAKHLRT